MVWVLGVLALAFLVFLVLGAATGRVSLTSCCGVDASRDLRMRAAFEDVPVPAKQSGAESGPVPSHRPDGAR